jgi:hemolysin III
MNRWEWGRIKNPLRGILHGGAAVAALIGVGLLAQRAAGGRQLIAGLIFGLSLVAMYTISTLYHSVGWQERRKAFMQRLDHSMIFLVVAATFTPFGLVVLDGWVRPLLLGVVWTTGLIGIVLKFGLPRVRTGLSISLQHVMGWSSLLALPLVWQRIGPGAVWLVLAGGLFYSVGTVIFITKRPRLYPAVFSYHELFHLFVIAGSACHFLSVFWFVMPYGAI